MKRNTHLKVSLIAILFLVSIGTSFAQITLSLRYVGSDDKYHLYLKPNTSVTGANPYLTDGSTTVTVTAPTGSISISNVSSISPVGVWSLSTIAINNGDVSSGAPANTDFFVFTPSGDFSSINYTSGVEVELFSFSVVGSCNGSLNILPSAGQTAKLGTLNIGSYYSVLGYNLGIGTNHFNGTYNMISGCPLDTDGDLVLDSIDLDDDNDGILDTVEDGQLSADTDGDGVPNRLDLDSDNDGINDVVEAAGVDLNRDGIADGIPNSVGIPSSAGAGDTLVGDDFDGDSRPNPYDLDSDNDGINDLTESGNPLLADSNKDGIVDGVDSDGDGIVGMADGNPSRGDVSDPLPVNTDGTLGPNYLDLDSDGDGLTDLAESGIPNPTTLDTNGDGKIDNSTDSDNDGIPQVVDGLPTAFGDANNPVLSDVDGDGIPDYIDPLVLLADSDGDSVPDSNDLDDDNDGILDTVEDGQLSADTDGDGVPNRLDLDSDNDGINDVVEAGGVDLNRDGIADGVPSSVGIPSSAGAGDTLVGDDFDGDSRPNPYDLDSDNDGINDLTESGNPLLADSNKDGIVDGVDSDGDGIVGMADGNPSRGDISDPLPVNTDGTLGPNYLDLDSDGDGLTDLAESGIPNPTTLDTNGDGKIDNSTDSDNDGIPQVVDGLPTAFGDANNPVLSDVDGDGIPDYIDPLVLLADSDGDSVPDSNDLDDDNDGILDTVEDGQLSADTDGDGVPNRLDLDSDNDGINDVVEAGGVDLNRDGIADGVPSSVGIPSSAGAGDTLVGDDFDGDGRPNPYDLDSDNDGINDLTESGNPLLADSNKDGIVDGVDSDGDGIVGMADGNPSRGDVSDPLPVNTDGTLGPNYLDLDSDGDGLTDLAESGIPNPTTLDTNGDGKIDNSTDSDNDGIPQVVDGLPTAFGDANNPVLSDVDGDGIPDYIDPLVLLADSDGDSVPDSNDLDDDNDGILDTVEDAACSVASQNCDTDGDGIPNRIDLDSDGDGIKDVIEAGGVDSDNDGKIGAGNPNVNPQGVSMLANSGIGLTLPDTDNDTKKNPYDVDSDNDGISDLTEGVIDTDGDGLPNYIDTDSDNDGIPDSVEGTIDMDADGKPNYLDTDSDNDGILDSVEGITDIDNDGKPNYLDLDSDGDTIPDIIEGIVDTDSDGKPDYLDLDSDADGVPDITDQCRLVKGVSPTGCPASTASIQIKMLLQGAMFNTTDGLMRDELRAKGVIPSVEPYTAFASARFTHKSNGGGETIGSGVTNVIGANAIVDWVFIELRDATNPSNVIKTKSALLQRDGDVVESSDGVSPVKFMDVAGLSFYVAIKHRNHLGAMTANPIAIATTGTIVDFTTLTSAQIWNSAVNYDGYEQVQNVVGSGKNALWAGNTNANNKVKYVGPANDQSIIFSQVLEYSGNVSQLYNYDFATPLYIQGDVNMDGKVKYRGSDNDSNYIFGNIVSLYLLNTSKLYNYDLLLEQIP